MPREGTVSPCNFNRRSGQHVLRWRPCHVRGGIGMGTPDGIVRALSASGKRDMALIVNDAARPQIKGVPRQGRLPAKIHQLSHRRTPNVRLQMKANDLKGNVLRQGTFVERVGAAGIGLVGMLTRTRPGTTLADSNQAGRGRRRDHRTGTAPTHRNRAECRAASMTRATSAYMRSATNFNPICPWPQTW